MEPEPTSAPFGDAYRSALRPETVLLQEVIELSKRVQSMTCRTFSLNPTDLVALCVVMMRGQLGPTDLAKQLQLSTAAVTTVVNRLEANGHVTRSQHPTDGRGVLVAPTDEAVGRGLTSLIPVAKSIDGGLDDFDDAERAVIARYLESVAARQRQALVASSDRAASSD
ncbi:hypothetical protein BH11ACT5_BH11ACT5_11580 [soil metagenome]